MPWKRKASGWMPDSGSHTTSRHWGGGKMGRGRGTKSPGGWLWKAEPEEPRVETNNFRETFL